MLHLCCARLLPHWWLPRRSWGHFALVERAAAGGLKLSEMIALFWHCLVERDSVSRDEFADAVVAGGLAAATPALKILLGQILGGR